jgi:prevent-host-death family protein
MEEIGAFEAKNTLGALLDRVEMGEEIVITRHGKPVARLAPYPAGANLAESRAAAERIRARVENLRGKGFRWDELKADRDRGRP